MAIASQLKEVLDKAHVPYRVEEHPLAYTAQYTAQVSHVKGEEMVKTVIVSAEGVHCMLALPASRQIDMGALEEMMGTHDIHLAEEREFVSEFPECELGAMPPVGTIFNMKLIAADRLREDEEIAFNAGNHREIVRMNRKDWERLAHPVWGHFTRP